MIRIILFAITVSLCVGRREDIPVMFTDMDADASGLLTLHEFDGFFKGMPLHDHTHHHMDLGSFLWDWDILYHDPKDIAELIFAALDQTNDGYLKNDDLVIVFDKMDKNGDKDVDTMEFIPYFDSIYNWAELATSGK